MKTHKILLFALMIISAGQAFSSTRYYRLSYRDDPSTTIVVGWDQNGGNNPKVYYDVVDHGTNYSAYAFNHAPDRTVNHQGMNNNFARLNGLQPNTVYYFVIHDSDGTSARMSFKTIPDNPDIPISFLSGGDSRTGAPIIEPSNCRDIRKKANRMVGKLLPNFIAFSGDFILESSVGGSTLWPQWFDDWQLTISTLEGRMTPVICTFGNHELNDDLDKLFDIPVADSYYAISFGGRLLRLYCLNSENNACTSTTQLNWFTNDLQTHTGNATEPYWKAVQYHIPMVPHGEYSDRGDMISCWANLFEPYKMRLSMDGHTHVVKWTWPIVPSMDVGSEKGFIRDDLHGTVYIGEGTWGAPLRDLYAANTWTRDQAKINAFMLVCVSKQKMNIYTVKYENADIVGQVQLNDTCCSMPSGIDLWTPANGQVVTLLNDFSFVRGLEKQQNLCTVFPNPSQGIITIKVPESFKGAEATLANAWGIPVKEKLLLKSNTENSLNFNDIARGVYFIFIKSAQGTESHKIIIE